MGAFKAALGDLWDEYARASAEFATAKRESELADQNYASALDRLNKVQDTLDSALAEFRTGAPVESRWGQNKASRGEGRSP